MINESEVEEVLEPTPYNAEYRRHLLEPDEDQDPDISDISDIEDTQKEEGMISKLP